MKVEVRYFSKSGNTKKLAEAIAEQAGVKAETVDQPIEEETDVLFLGAAVYYAGINGKVKEFMAKLDPAKVKKVVIFSDSAMAERAYPSIAKELTSRGISVAEDNFYCRGQFLSMNKNHPDAKDLEDAKEFAKKFL